MIALLLGALLSASGSPMPFAEAPAVEVWAGEDWPADALASASRLPGATLGLALKSNMLRPEAAAVLRKGRASLVRLAPGLSQVHVDELRGLPKTTLVVPLAGPLDATLSRLLEKLGPQPQRVTLGKLDAAVAASLASLKHAEVELDLRGRVPDQEELGIFLGLSRVQRVVRLRADDPPAIVAALKAVKPVRLVVESVEGRVPEARTAALIEAGIATRVAVDLTATPDDLKRLAALPRVSLELRLSGDADIVVPKARGLLESLVVAR